MRKTRNHQGPVGTYYEFFAGGGMARAGLGDSWSCLFANDFDHKKAKSYAENWGGNHLKVGDVRAVSTNDLPPGVDLAWASFPCQDLSLAGGGAGLKGDRSGTFWPFWQLMTDLGRENRQPNVIALENVCGTLTSHGGKDFTAICEAFQASGYRFGAVVMDAALFVPHSRPRLFVIGVHQSVDIGNGLTTKAPSDTWHTKSVRTAHKRLSTELQADWIWWNIPEPPARENRFADLIEDKPASVDWHSKAETLRLLSMMSKVNLDKVETAKKAGRRMVGTIYKRTRLDADGNKVQRAEVRFDDVAGCLRTPAGGSSRQLILVVDGKEVNSRLISTRETARLMGLPDDYALPEKYNEAYHLTGDGVVVPVVRHLAQHILEPLVTQRQRLNRSAA
ncbi:DNA cytosine methyltransferase [Marinobacter salarius]|uniref:DNA cytosine methyltransferase n=1 Tax=Marinobacter salarius TaxID=1420917 RepID=UPI00125A4E12|nr:DNA cytosine methyltransferase [Marinobacter salarius]VVT28161.1 Cytosine-specific methyltransferase [Marinobacter salarius]